MILRWAATTTDSLALLGYARIQASGLRRSSITPTCRSRKAAARSAPRFGVERVVKRKVVENGQEVEKEVHENLLADGSYSVGSEIKDGYPEFTLGVLKKLGWDKDLTAAGAGDHQARQSRQIPTRSRGRRDLSGGIQRVAIKHGCSPYGNAKARMIAWNLPDPVPVHREPIYTPRPDLVAKYPTRPDARQFRVPNLGFTVQKAAVDNGRRQALPVDPELRPPGRIRGRRRRDALQPVAGRVETGHVCRNQPGGRQGAGHRQQRLGLGHGRRKRLQGPHAGRW